MSEEQVSEAGEPAPAPTRAPGRRRLVWLVVGLAVAIALITWLIVRGGDDEPANPAPAVTAGQPQVLGEDELRAFGREQAIPIYWAGPRPNRRYELTQTSGGQVFIRYLPPGVEAGDRRRRSLTVGTYPQKNAYAALDAVGDSKGQSKVVTQTGALVVTRDEPPPTSAYFTFPDADFQVEVYAPTPGQAQRLVLNGDIRRLE
ncbi:MAG: hypothetical protein MUC84_08630 [Solirubrobacteraceae bacterium]|jgi:hypothetical protein|nr:hypothetical protein [Solirubrobacteraceae bacterium]